MVVVPCITLPLHLRVRVSDTGSDDEILNLAQPLGKAWYYPML